MSSVASASRCWPFHVNARLFMLVSVLGWLSPSFVLQLSITCTSSASASSHRPWFLYVDARLAMLQSVSSWSTPNIFLLALVDCSDVASASTQFPTSKAYHAALYSSKAQSSSEPSLSSCCSAADLACANSPWHTAQFSWCPVGKAAQRLPTNCCFYCSSSSWICSHFRVASCTSLCISKLALSVFIDMNE